MSPWHLADRAARMAGRDLAREDASRAVILGGSGGGRASNVAMIDTGVQLSSAEPPLAAAHGRSPSVHGDCPGELRATIATPVRCLANVPRRPRAAIDYIVETGPRS